MHRFPKSLHGRWEHAGSIGNEFRDGFRLGAVVESDYPTETRSSLSDSRGKSHRFISPLPAPVPSPGSTVSENASAIQEMDIAEYYGGNTGVRRHIDRLAGDARRLVAEEAGGDTGLIYEIQREVRDASRGVCE